VNTIIKPLNPLKTILERNIEGRKEVMGRRRIRHNSYCMTLRKRENTIN